VAGEHADPPCLSQPPGDLGEVLAYLAAVRPFVVPGVLPDLVDAILTEGGKPGTVYGPAVGDLFQTRNAHSTHDGSLAVALELGRLAGLRLPSEIRIWAVEARDVTSFSERLTADVERAVPVVTEDVMRFLGVRCGASNGART